MVNELSNRSELFAAHRAAGDHDSATALSDGRRRINKSGKIVTLNFGLQSGEQVRLAHSVTAVRRKLLKLPNEYQGP
jgi:hypothetical protein